MGNPRHKYMNDMDRIEKKRIVHVHCWCEVKTFYSSGTCNEDFMFF